jgi:hypothetical protein
MVMIFRAAWEICLSHVRHRFVLSPDSLLPFVSVRKH